MEMSGYGYPASNGETWDSIARDLYGDEKYMAELLAANPGICRKVRFEGNESIALPVIVIPKKGEAGIPVSAPWREG